MPVSNLHRIQWVDAMIRAERYPNCRTIAAKFEISPRQAARDIEYRGIAGSRAFPRAATTSAPWTAAARPRPSTAT